MPAPRSATCTDTASAPSSPISTAISLDDAGARKLDRLHGVAQEVQDHLLEMDLVDDDHRQRAGRLQLDADVAQLAVRLHHVDAFPDRARDVDLLRLELVPLHHAAHARHHVAGPRRLADDLVQQVRHPREVGRVFPHAAARRQRVVLDRPQRLGDLVGERDRHLPRRVHPHQVRQALAPLGRFDLGGLLPVFGGLARMAGSRTLRPASSPREGSLRATRVPSWVLAKKSAPATASETENGTASNERTPSSRIFGRSSAASGGSSVSRMKRTTEPLMSRALSHGWSSDGGQHRHARGPPEVRSAELVAPGNPLPQAHPLHPEEAADVLEPLLDRAGLVARPGKQQRREDAGRQALEADRLLELFLRALAGEGAAEDLRQEPHPLEKLLRPGPLPPDAAEAETPVQLPVHDHRHRHVRFQPDAFPVCPVEACLRGQIVQTRRIRPAGLRSRVDHAHGQSFLRRPERDDALHPGDGKGVRDLDASGCRRPRVQRAPLDTKGFDDATQGIIDGLVEAPRRQVDEARGQLQKEAFEPR